MEPLPLSAEPLTLPAGQATGLSDRQQTRLLWILLLLGVLVRATRYLVCFPLWGDECQLVYNLLDRGYLELLSPLEQGQVAPAGFLWAMLAATRWLGFSEYALRLPAFLCSLASLLLFRHVAGRLLRGTALVMAVGVFAAAYPAVRYAAEAKPYGADLFVSLLLVAVLVEWRYRGRDARWIWLLAVLALLSLLFSYPAVFVAGAVSLAAAWELWAHGDRRGWVPWIGYNLALAGGVAAVYVLFMRVQNATELASMRVQWQDTFPPLGQPLRLLPWLIKAHTGQMLAYPAGGARGGSVFTLFGCAVAVVVLVRRREWFWLLACLAPLGLNFAAAALGRYPYGGMMRFQLYMAPQVSLLMGFGLAVILLWWPKRLALRFSPTVLAAGVLMLLAAASIGRDLWRPYRDAIDIEHRQLARRLWIEMPRETEMVCLATDGNGGLPRPELASPAPCMYLCNQRIYWPLHARAEAPRLERISADRPLRCVWFRPAAEPRQDAALDRWLQAMKPRYRLVARHREEVPAKRTGGGGEATAGVLEIFEFLPGGSCQMPAP